MSELRFRLPCRSCKDPGCDVSDLRFRLAGGSSESPLSYVRYTSSCHESRTSNPTSSELISDAENADAVAGFSPHDQRSTDHASSSRRESPT